MSGRVSDNTSDDSTALIVLVRKCADARIANLARRKDAIQAMTPQRIDEYVGQLVIGGILRRVELGVRGAEFRQHGIDNDCELFPGVSGISHRLVTHSYRRPVQSTEVSVVEAVAHRLPHLVESSPTRLSLRSVRLPRTQGSEAPESQDLPAGDPNVWLIMMRLPIGMLLEHQLLQASNVALAAPERLNVGGPGRIGIAALLVKVSSSKIALPRAEVGG